MRRAARADEVVPLRHALTSLLPEVSSAPLRESMVCLLTNTPDLDFLIDVHPNHPQAMISSACSGHGFELASAIGEIQADLPTTGRSSFDLTPFRLGRFGQ